MAVAFKRNAGQVAATIGTIFNSSTGLSLVHSMSFHNTDSVARTLEVWLTTTGPNRRKILDTSLDAQATLIIDTKFVLANTDLIEAEAGAGSVIDYWISRAEIT